MDVTRIEQRAYIIITVLRRSSARECHSELVDAVETSAHLARVLLCGMGTIIVSDKKHINIFLSLGTDYT